MPYRREVFVEQMPLVDRFTKHLVYYRAIRSNLDRYNQASSFWGDTCTAHLLQASTYWCMVFGSQGCNATHWKNLGGDEEQLLKSFREGLYSTLDISESRWKAYWEEMVDFRNCYVAHRELRFDRPVPVFDLALKAAFYYDSWIRKVIHPDVLDELPLKQLVDAFQAKVTTEIVTALEATAAEPSHAADAPQAARH